MKSRVTLALITGSCLWSADPPALLNVKTGEWHTVITTTGRSGSKSQSGTNCIDKDRLAAMTDLTDSNPACKRTLVSSSPTRQEMKIECQAPSGNQSGTTVIEAPNQETMKLHTKMTGTSRGIPTDMTVDWFSNWVGPTCAPPKPKKK